jgi:hypothetical protein
MKNQKDDDLTYFYLFFGIVFLSLITTIAALKAWNDGEPTRFMTLFGYANWFYPNDTHPIMKYLFSRPWHLIPIITITMSILAVLKTLITGKCAALKGVKFSELIIFNVLIVPISIAPMFIETIISIIFIAAAIIAAGFGLQWMYCTIERKFNDACICTYANRNNEGNIYAEEVKSPTSIPNWKRNLEDHQQINLDVLSRFKK